MDTETPPGEMPEPRDAQARLETLLDELTTLRASHDHQIAQLNALTAALAHAPTLDAALLARIQAITQPDTAALQAELAALRAEVAGFAVALRTHEQQHRAPRPPWWRRWWPR